MMKIELPLMSLATALMCLLTAVPARALVTRSFVSAAGSDSNNCANVATPCRHFQNAVNVTAPNGEVVALDPANYGSITISHGITIDGQNWAYIAPPNGGNAITINADNTDKVIVNGVLLDGVGTTGATNGVVFNSGSSLTITNSVVRSFSNYGVNFAPASAASFVISNTTVSNIPNIAIYLNSSNGGVITAVLDHVSINNNDQGVYVLAAASRSVEVLIKESSIDNNYSYGVVANSTCNNAVATVALRSVSLNQIPQPIYIADCSNVYISHVVQTLAPPLPYNPGVIFGSHNNNHVYSDGTNLTSAPPGSFEAWSTQ